MATGTIFITPIQLAMDTNDNPASGAKAYFFLAGTSTPVTVYQNVGLTTPHAVPVVANSAGRFAEIYLTPGVSYKVDIQNSAGVSLSGYPADNVAAIPAASGDLDSPGTAGENLAAGKVVYESDGSGGKTAGSWYLADSGNAYSSTGNKIGMTPNAIGIGESGSIRLEGRVTGLSSLTIGATQYVTTSGGLTATAGVLSRAVGQADSTTSLILFGSQPTTALPEINNALCEFRLSLTTAVPVTITDVTAATTLYAVPYKGNRIALYDAAGNARIYTSAQVSIAIPATTVTVYDVFGYQNAGALTLELLAWTNDTTRATALVATVVSGVYTKSGDATRRYLGTCRTTGVSGQTEDSLTKRYVWNYYNRVRRPLQKLSATATYNYTTDTWRQAEASATNQVEVVVGVQEAPVAVDLSANCSNAGGTAKTAVSVGLDSTTTPAGNQRIAMDRSDGVFMQPFAAYLGFTGVGWHKLCWLEISTAVGTTTWTSAASVYYEQSGMSGFLDG